MVAVSKQPAAAIVGEQLRRDALREPNRRILHRIQRQMRIMRGRFHVRVTEQAADHRQPLTERQHLRCMRVNAGFHAVLFHGLRFEEEITITDDMRIVPFEKVRAYVDETLLRPFSPNLIVPEPWAPVGAIVKLFEWHPEFLPPDEEICLDLDWGGSFREDGERLVELIAITHAAPVVCLVTMHYCAHPVACALLGQPHRRAG